MSSRRVRGLLALAGMALLAVFFTPARAYAGGGGESAGNLSEVVLVLVVVAVAYLVAHALLERIERRLLTVSGIEYILLGVLLGPTFPQLRAFEDLTGLLPIIALAAGWFGILRGMELARFPSAPPGAVQLALFDDLGAGLVVAIPAGLLFTGTVLFEETWSAAWMSAGVLGCAAAMGATDPIDVLERRYRLRPAMIKVLRRVARLGDAVSILVYGALVCVFNEHSPDSPLDTLLEPSGVWVGLLVIATALGVGFGVLFRYFLAGDESENARFLALIGIITFASGAAWFLELSILYVSLLLGFVLFWRTRVGAEVLQTMERTQRPMTLVLLLFAGALWRPPPAVQDAVAGFWEAEPDILGSVVHTASASVMWIVAPTIAFVVLRLVGKWLGSQVGSWGQPVRSDMYRGLLGMGDISIAMAVGFKLIFDGPAVVDVAYTTILGAVVVHDLIAPRLLRSLLVDSGELLFEKPEKGKG